MPSELIEVRGEAREGKPYFSLHHVQFPSGEDPVKSELDGTGGAEISYTVYDLGGDDPATAIVTGTLDKAVAWFNTLQTDDWWDNEDKAGYNFRGKHLGTDFPNGLGTYKIEYSASTNKTDANGVTYDTIDWLLENQEKIEHKYFKLGKAGELPG